MRNPDGHVAATFLHADDEILDRAAQHRAFRIKERQTGPDLVYDGEQVQFFPELAVVAFLRFGHHRLVLRQLVLRGEAQSVDSLHLRIFLLAAPVRARDFVELPRADVFRVRHMRTAAEVNEVASLIDRDRRDVRGPSAPLRFARDDIACFFGLNGGSPFRLQVIQQLDFVNLPHPLEAFDRLVNWHFAQERDFFDELLHLRVDRLQVFRRHRASDINIVIKSVLHDRSHAELRLGKKSFDRGGHNVSRAVTLCFNGIFHRCD